VSTPAPPGRTVLPRLLALRFEQIGRQMRFPRMMFRVCMEQIDRLHMR